MEPHLTLREEQAVNRIVRKGYPTSDGNQYVIRDGEWVVLETNSLPSVQIDCGTSFVDACLIDCGAF